MERIVLIYGPTASSKSRIALLLAERLGGEIINADSRQFFKYMRIGTASPTDDHIRRLPHHLYNIIEPDKAINAGMFKRLADEKIREILSRGRIPLVVGGTGLYLKVLKYGIAEIPPIPQDIRSSVVERIKRDGLSSCYRFLKEIDSEYSNTIKPNDRQRIQRALEVYLTTGKKFSSFHKSHGFSERCYQTVSINILPPKPLLYERIDRRTRDIFRDGILDETRFLIERGYTSSHPLTAIGYKEALSYLKGEIKLNEAIETTSRRTRQYAKRQITWFKRGDGHVFNDPDDIEKIVEITYRELRNV